MHTDHQYIEALRHNDPKKINEIYQRYASQARNWIVQHGGSVADAQDVFQEAVLALFDKAQNKDFVLTCPLGGMLHIIYSRKWIDRLRQKNKESGVRKEEELRYSQEVSPDELTLAEEALEASARHDKLNRCFEQLSDVCRQLLTLLTNGTPPREAALMLQMNSVDTLYRRKNACMERWRTLFQTV